MTEGLRDLDGEWPRAAERRVDESELYELPRVDAGPIPEPDTDTRVDFAARRCANCDNPVGRPTGQRPAGRTAGRCGKCREPFDFPPPLDQGDVVEGRRYEVRGVIARGGYGHVYLAYETNPSRTGDERRRVALKGLVNTGGDAATRLLDDEARLLTQLDHPNIVRVLTVAEHADTGGQFIVMEYVHGLTLDAVREEAHARGDELGFRQVAQYGLSLLVALDHLHQRGLVYCDLKPDNVIHLDADTKIKLVDMGAVRRRVDMGPPTDGSTMPDYIAATFFRVGGSEVRRHGVTPRADLYALGQTLRALLRPRLDQVSVNRECPRGIAEEFLFHVVNRATTDYEGRFADAEEMRDQLAGVLRDLFTAEDRRERPVRSAIFEERTRRLDGGLAGVPTVAQALADEPNGPRVGSHRLRPLDVALALPVPHVSATDAQSDFLGRADATDPERWSEKLDAVRDKTIEVHLARVRAALEIPDVDRAAAALGDVAEAERGGWRVRWHQALVALGHADRVEARDTATPDDAAADLKVAQGLFEEVARHWPGEPAPKVALALCLECRQQHRAAEPWYRLLLMRDRDRADAAFGLARVLLTRGARSAAVDALKRLSPTSRHHDAARVAIVAIRTSSWPPDADWPLPAEVAAAGRAIPTLPVNRDERKRLVLPVLAMAHRALADHADGTYWAAAGPLVEPAPPPPGPTRRRHRGAAVDGTSSAAEAAALALSRALSGLADQTDDADRRADAVDRAHAVRPWTWT